MTDSLTYDALKNAVRGSAAAFRCRRRLQPAGGEGDKVFPPTFAGAVYAVERRRVPGLGEAVQSVLLTIGTRSDRGPREAAEGVRRPDLI